MTRPRLYVACLLAILAPVAYADHEESLMYPLSLAVVLFLAIGVALVPWHRRWVRALTAVVLIAANIALWRDGMYARAHYDLDYMLAIMVLVPCAVATLCGWIFWKLVRRTYTV